MSTHPAEAVVLVAQAAGRRRTALPGHEAVAAVLHLVRQRPARGGRQRLAIAAQIPVEQCSVEVTYRVLSKTVSAFACQNACGRRCVGPGGPTASAGSTCLPAAGVALAPHANHMHTLHAHVLHAYAQTDCMQGWVMPVRGSAAHRPAQGNPGPANPCPMPIPMRMQAWHGAPPGHTVASPLGFNMKWFKCKLFNTRGTVALTAALTLRRTA